MADLDRPTIAVADTRISRPGAGSAVSALSRRLSAAIAMALLGITLCQEHAGTRPVREFPTGTIIPVVVTKAEPDQTYAVDGNHLSRDDLDVLRASGGRTRALAEGSLAPTTDEDLHFVDVAERRKPPVTIVETNEINARMSRCRKGRNDEGLHDCDHQVGGVRERAPQLVWPLCKFPRVDQSGAPSPVRV
jgi:hypothetical protein